MYMNNKLHDNFSEHLHKPIWNKPNFVKLKEYLMKYNVDETYINITIRKLNACYNKKINPFMNVNLIKS